MDNSNLLLIFIAVTSAAVLIQACMLIGMYLAIRKTSARVEALATEVKTKVLPTAELTHNMLLDLRPKVETVLSNVSESTTVLKTQVRRLDAAMNDFVDRARLQVIRADELIGRTLDKVEETGDMVHKTVVSPVKQFSGVMHGVTAGIEYYFGNKRRRRDGVSVPQDEMFI
jgi:hypothetical protein